MSGEIKFLDFDISSLVRHELLDEMSGLERRKVEISSINSPEFVDLVDFKKPIVIAKTCQWTVFKCDVALNTSQLDCIMWELDDEIIITNENLSTFVDIDADRSGAWKKIHTLNIWQYGKFC